MMLSMSLPAPHEEHHITLLDILEDAIALYKAMENDRFLGNILPRFYTKLPVLTKAKEAFLQMTPVASQRELAAIILDLRYPKDEHAPATNEERTEFRKLEILLEIMQICARLVRQELALPSARLALRSLQVPYSKAFPYRSMLLAHIQALFDREELQNLRAEKNSAPVADPHCHGLVNGVFANKSPPQTPHSFNPHSFNHSVRDRTPSAPIPIPIPSLTRRI